MWNPVTSSAVYFSLFCCILFIAIFASVLSGTAVNLNLKMFNIIDGDRAIIFVTSHIFIQWFSINTSLLIAEMHNELIRWNFVMLYDRFVLNV